jgi:3',5'-cyclic AMP phosphodiesterase CpdA
MQFTLDRRQFLKVTSLAALGACTTKLGASTTPEPTAINPGNLEFVFFTDVHLQPELHGIEGSERCFRQIAALKPVFALCGGDLVFDANKVPAERAKSLYDLYSKTEHLLDLPLHHTIGNHDIFGLGDGKPTPSTENSGKKMYEDRFGPTYSSFDQGGYHFVMLDSVFLTADQDWEGRVSQQQLAWLAADLARVGPKVPVIITTHVPLVTAYTCYRQPSAKPMTKSYLTVANSTEVLKVIEPYRVIAVLQGHTHINEVVLYKGCEFITSGAVCGDWWKGPRWGFSEGFSVISLRGGKLEHRYETFGWVAG